jgi:hypothetical protein
MFPRRFHGSTFNVLYSNDPIQKTAIKAHVVTSLDAFEIISADWRSSVSKFQRSDTERLENRKTSVVLGMKPGRKVTSIVLTTKPDPSGNLSAALAQTVASSKPEIPFLALVHVLPTLLLPERADDFTLHKSIMEASTQILQSFGVSRGVNGPFVDAFTCVHRMRFRNIAARALAERVSDAAALIRRHFAAVWARAAVRATRPAESPAGRVYFARLAHHISQTFARVSGVPCEDLVQAAAEYAATGRGDGASEAAARVEAAVGDLEMEAPCDRGHVVLALNFALLTLAGVVVGMYPADIALVSQRIVEYTAAACQGPGGDEKKAAIIQVQATYLRDMLGLLDGKRYEDVFQWPFALWELQPPDLGPLQLE